jgi:hypothetical protein
MSEWGLVISRRTLTGCACALRAALSSLTLLQKANICRRPRRALSEIAEPDVRAQIGRGLLGKARKDSRLRELSLFFHSELPQACPGLTGLG